MTLITWPVIFPNSSSSKRQISRKITRHDQTKFSLYTSINAKTNKKNSFSKSRFSLLFRRKIYSSSESSSSSLSSLSNSYSLSTDPSGLGIMTNAPKQVILLSVAYVPNSSPTCLPAFSFLGT